MSHVTKIDEVVFGDVSALQAAIAQLQKEGVKCELIPDSVPRAYSLGQMKKADQVLKLADSPYDIGLYYNAEKKGLTAQTDFYGGHIHRILGAPIEKGESQNQANMGKLYRAYAVEAATRQAVRQGYTVRRQVNANGGVQLVMTGVGMGR